MTILNLAPKEFNVKKVEMGSLCRHIGAFQLLPFSLTLLTTQYSCRLRVLGHAL